MGYVEEDDEEREESAGETDEQYEAQLGGVRQCGEGYLGRACCHQAGQTGH